MHVSEQPQDQEGGGRVERVQEMSPREVAALTRRYDDCVESLRAWRQAHLKRGAVYLRAHPDDHAVASTGLTLVDGDDPVGTFASTMRARIGETARARLLPHESPRPGV
jgi:hypothetical protein